MFHPDFDHVKISYDVRIEKADIPDDFVRILTRAKNNPFYRYWCIFMAFFVMDNAMTSKIGMWLFHDENGLNNLVVEKDAFHFSGNVSDTASILALLRYMYRPRNLSAPLCGTFHDISPGIFKNPYQVKIFSRFCIRTKRNPPA